MGFLNSDDSKNQWDSLTYAQKNHQLYLAQKSILDQFLKRGAISQAQHDKSLRDLTEKMGEQGYRRAVCATAPLRGCALIRLFNPPRDRPGRGRRKMIHFSQCIG